MKTKNAEMINKIMNLRHVATGWGKQASLAQIKFIVSSAVFKKKGLEGLRPKTLERLELLLFSINF